MANLFHSIALGTSIIIAAGCASQPSNYKTYLEADQSYAYQELTHFSIEPKQFVGNASDAEPDIYDAVQSELKAKGYQFTQTGGDFAVEFYARRQEEKKMVVRPVHSPVGDFTEYRMEDFLKGALVIHLRDLKTNKVFWKNTYSAQSQKKLEGAALKEKIQQAVKKLFTPFPHKNKRK